MKLSFLSVILLLLALGCEPKPEVAAPKDSSAEAKALADAAAKAASDNPADALALAELKKLSDAAATGDAKAKEAIDKYRASK
ncbi:MAG: hypothetical protein EBU81_07535 [Proteobacteria bacterium]|nr:hypothetical protein [Pseudomonadota bacterium]